VCENVDLFPFRDMSRLSDVLESKNEENEAYLSEIEVSVIFTAGFL
jgi:hypothetical protein